MDDKDRLTMLVGQKVSVSLLAGEVAIGGKLIAYTPDAPAYITVMDEKKTHFVPFTSIAEITISNKALNEVIEEAK